MNAHEKERNEMLSNIDEEKIKALQEQPVCEGFDGEIGHYLSDRWKFGCVTPITPVILPNFTTEDLKECARHFAQWQKEQDDKELSEKIAGAYQLGLADKGKMMMKDVVEGVVVKDINNKLAVTAKNVNLDGFKFGEKVRIIIVKKDGK